MCLIYINNFINKKKKNKLKKNLLVFKNSFQFIHHFVMPIAPNKFIRLWNKGKFIQKIRMAAKSIFVVPTKGTFGGLEKTQKSCQQ